MTNEKPVREKLPAKRRLFFIDNLRTLLIILVVLWHMAVTYGAPGFWPYQESRPDDLTTLVYTLFSAVNMPYVMAFFFMITGYFTPRSYDRKGFGPFLKERLVRLSIPLLFYILVFDPLITYGIRANVHGYPGSFWEYLGGHFRGYRSLGVGPLWFVEGLLIFIIVYALWRLVANWVSSAHAANQAQRDGKAPSNAAIVMFALILGVVTFVVRIRFPIGSIFQPLGLPLSFFPQYVGLFVVGIMAYRRNWFLGIPDAMGKLWLGIAVICIVVLLPIVFVLGGALEGNTDPYAGGVHWQSFAYSVWEQFVCMGMVIGLLVWFRNRFDHQGPLAKAMSDSSYAVYLIHAPVVIYLALALRGIKLYPLLKFALVSPVAVVLCFLIAYFLRKLPLVRSIL